MSATKQLVFIVDDEADIRDLLARALEAAGFEAVCIASGLDMMKRLRERTPDLILLDIMMSWVSGIELCRTLKNEATFRHIPVVIITAHHRTEIESKVAECGADGCLYKPFRIADLITTVQRFTGQAPAQSAPSA